MARRSTDKLILAVALAIVYWFLSARTPLAPPPSSTTPTPSLMPSAVATAVPPPADQPSDMHIITRIVDGDTVEIETGQKVRYIGIDTPETHHPTKKVECFGREATERNELLVKGKQVRMVKDVSETDRYGRLLRYVFIPSPKASEEAVFVNELLVREGYAHAVTFPPDVAYEQRFREAEQDARINTRGLWKSCASAKPT